MAAVSHGSVGADFMPKGWFLVFSAWAVGLAFADQKDENAGVAFEGDFQENVIAGMNDIESVKPKKQKKKDVLKKLSRQRKKRKDVLTQVKPYREWGNFWRKAGMERLDTRSGFMARVNEPKGDDKIEYIAIFASGQQGLWRLKKQKKKKIANVLSGSVGSYRKSGKYWINGKSLAAQFARCKNGYCFNPRTTLQFSIFDLRYEYQYSRKRRNAVLKGWLNFLLHKAGCKKSCKDLKAIYVAGGSRGGCFSMGMAQRMTRLPQLKHVKILGLSYDGVCKEREFGVKEGKKQRTKLALLKYFLRGVQKKGRRKKVRSLFKRKNDKREKEKNFWEKVKFAVKETKEAIRNPCQKKVKRDKVYFGWKTDVNAQFKKEDKRRVCLAHIAGGETVFGARTFTHKKCLQKSCKIGKWYSQRWEFQTHGDILRNYKKNRARFKWSLNQFKQCRSYLGLPSPGKLKPPGQRLQPVSSKAVELHVITHVLPERNTWKIEGRCRRKKGFSRWKLWCNGGPYYEWYSKVKTGCRLRKGCQYRATCGDRFGQGWARGYMQIGKLRICEDYTYRMGHKYVADFAL